MNRFGAYAAIDTLKEISKERKQIRRKLCRFIRDNIDNKKFTDYWLQRKSDGRYLSDLSDSQLIHYVENICEVLGGQKD